MSSTKQNNFNKQDRKTILLNIRGALDEACMTSTQRLPMFDWEADDVIDSNKDRLGVDDYKTLKMYAPNYVRTCNKASVLADLTRSTIHVYIEEEIKKMDNQF